jgi:flagellar protein FlaI
MSSSALPFDAETAHVCGNRDGTCNLPEQLPPTLREAAEQAPILLSYLHVVPTAEYGFPAYYAELSRKLIDLDPLNVIYPIKQGLFVHIYPDQDGQRDWYIPIEPTTTLDIDKEKLRSVEEGLLDIAEEVGAADTSEEKKEVFLAALDHLCTVREDRGNGRGNGNGDGGGAEQAKKRKSSLFGRRGPDKIPVTAEELEGIKYLVIRDKIGSGVLEPLLLDPYIEDISCSGLGNIFVEHKVFKSLRSTIVFHTMEELDYFVIALGERIRKPVSLRDPIVDAVLLDGSRINIVYGKDVSKRGSNFTIRKFSDTPFSIMELIEFGTMDYLIAAYMSMVIGEGMNVFVSGETASGKTTTMNAITVFIPPDAKIVSIEDTPELQVPHPNWIREMAKASASTESQAGVNMFDLLKAALRQRPDFIIIGEIRGAEGAIAFGAMQTGHSAMSTFHAASVEKLIQRITGEPINVPRAYIDNLNVVLIQSAVKLPNGRKGRRVMSVNEIIGYDPESRSFSFVEVFRWDPIQDRFLFPGEMNSYLLERKIAVMRGIPPNQMKTIYADLKRRARILERIHKEKGVRDFYEVLRVLSEAQRRGLF